MNLKDYMWFTLAQVIAIALFFAIVFYGPHPEYRTINCGVSEISPDFTAEMKQACRNARINNESKK